MYLTRPVEDQITENEMTENFCFPDVVHPHPESRFIGVNATTGFSKCHFIFTDGSSG